MYSVHPTHMLVIPGASTRFKTLEITFRNDGKILGAQGVGTKGV